MKNKKLTDIEWSKLEGRIKLLLFAGLDYCANTNRTESLWFSPNNPYNAEAFGICQALEVLGYGYFGPDNEPRNTDNFNLKYWFRTLENEVRTIGQEMGPKESFIWYKKIYYDLGTN